MRLAISPHALAEMQRRGISLAWVESTCQNPDQILPGYAGREVYQKRFSADAKTYLVRVITEIQGDNTVIVTVYRTSKIEKYGGTP